MATDFVRSALDWFAKLGLTVRDDAPKTIDLENRQWGEPAGGVGLSIREAAKEDPNQLPAVSAVLRNVSEQALHVAIPAWLLFYSFDVTRPDGQRAELTPFGREILKPQRHPRGVRLDVGPGEAVETEIPLGSIYEMRARGEYRIRVSARLPDGAEVRSNETGIRV